jgi:hypothetical protein
LRTVARSLLVVALLAWLVGPVWAGGAETTTVECGLFRDYTAPEPATNTPGSITFGVSGTPELIAADATLVPPADTSLPSLQGGAPTALTVIRSGGVITSLSFAPACTISGTPILVPELFGPSQDAYVIADRLFVPVEQVASNDGLAALIGTAADTSGTFSVTFDIDLSTGIPSGFTAQTTLVGIVIMLDGGDVQVGAATLPASVVDEEARAELQTAAELGVQTTVVVDGIGTIDQASGGPLIAISLTVAFVPPAPSTPAPSPVPALLPNTALDATGP